MHTVIADRCTGCELCLPPCPVDCIAILPAARVWSTADAKRARQHFSARNARLAVGSRKREQETATVDAVRRLRRAAVDAALARARTRRAARSVPGA
jgi:electron transport complex protein RnfB